MLSNNPKVDGKARVRAYQIALLMGFTKEQADNIADSGHQLQTIRPVGAMIIKEVKK